MTMCWEVGRRMKNGEQFGLGHRLRTAGQKKGKANKVVVYNRQQISVRRSNSRFEGRPAAWPKWSSGQICKCIAIRSGPIHAGSNPLLGIYDSVTMDIPNLIPCRGIEPGCHGVWANRDFLRAYLQTCCCSYQNLLRPIYHHFFRSYPKLKTSA